MANTENGKNGRAYLDIVFEGKLEGAPLALELNQPLEIALELSQHLIGQPAACKALAEVVSRAKAGLNNPNKPLGSLLFVGPMGVGKTEAGHALAKFLFDDPESPQLIVVESAIFDSPGYGDMTMFDEQFLSQPNVIVFRDIEKCSPQLLTLILSVTTEKKFRNSYVIFTYNVNGEEKSKPLVGFKTTIYEEDKSKVDLAQKFSEKPEFVSKVDKVVAYDPLKEADYALIFLQHINNRVPTLLVTPRCVESFLKRGKFEYGARGLKKVIERSIFVYLAAYVNSGVSLGETLICDITPEGKIVFHRPPEAADEKKEN